MGAMFMGEMAAGANGNVQAPVLLTGVSAAQDGGLLYSMETDVVSGIFLLDDAGIETRLYHTADFRIRHAVLDPARAMLAVTAFHKDNVRSNIATLPLHGNDFIEVTEGDSLDQVPQWIPGPRPRLVFQSAGIGRNAAGHFAGLGPCTIQELDVPSGDLNEVASEKDRDLLQPHQTADGTLFFIRKPYHTGAPAPTLLGSLTDALLFPFRIGRALFQYWNVFSMMYTGKPLVTSKGAVERRLDPRQLFIYGNLAAAQLAQSATSEDSLPVAPSSWELVRRGPGGQAEVLARNVLAYDVAGDGSIVYSDGAAITHLAADGSSHRLLKADLIERVLAL